MSRITECWVLCNPPGTLKFQLFEGQLCLLKIRSECARVHLNNHNIILSGMHNQLFFVIFSLASISLSYSRDYATKLHRSQRQKHSRGIVKSNLNRLLLFINSTILRNVSNAQFADVYCFPNQCTTTHII